MRGANDESGTNGDQGAGGSGRANRLAREKSPYLLQHAGNPVDWYPWGEEAFAAARRLDRPIFLSIGYSACHWCHVMERESFADPEVARLLNEHFIAVKVDREERPDIDGVYMKVCQAMTGAGGWPLTIVMTPAGRPFFAATYLPRRARFNLPGLLELLPHLAAVWKSDRAHLERVGDEAAAALGRGFYPGGGGALSAATLGAAPLEAAARQLAALFDAEYGGFGDAPKFPTPHQLTLLLRWWRRSGEKAALEMALRTLRAIHDGGIHDHIGGGYHRYSTDRRWLVPHFEKMLYDQALLAIAFLEAHQAGGDRFFARAAEDIFDYVLREMTLPGGGFCSAKDADSPGGEGAYYVWDKDEIVEALGPQDGEIFCAFYGLNAGGNFEGKNILHIPSGARKAAGESNGGGDGACLGSEGAGAGYGGGSTSGGESTGGRAGTIAGTGPGGLDEMLASARARLLEIRSRRERPLRDDKVLADWNGLMIAALARGARVTGRAEYAEAAGKAARFVLGTMRGPGGGLLHRWREGQAAIPAFLDDYAFMIWGLIELYETVFDPRHLSEALGLTDMLIEKFDGGRRGGPASGGETEGGGLGNEGAGEGDKGGEGVRGSGGGFFFTATDSEELIARSKEIYDGAVPAGNSVAALCLLRLGRMTGRDDLERRADLLLREFAGALEAQPNAYAQLLAALDFALGPAVEIVIAGKPGASDTKAMLAEAARRFLPRAVTLLRPPGEAPDILSLAPMLAGMVPLGGAATAYVCQGYSCGAPARSMEEFARRLDGIELPAPGGGTRSKGDNR